MTDNILVIPNHEEMVQRNLIVTHYAGSIAYGTNLPSSDIDIRGIFIADRVFFQTPWFKIGESASSVEDTKFYELQKYLTLLVEQNPNIVETMWVDECDLILKTPFYETLRSYRNELLSSKCAFTYSGYALSQLKRIKGHNKWINNPKPEAPPRQIDYISLIQDFSSDKYFKFTGDDMLLHRQNHKLIPYGNNIFGLYQMKGYSLFDDRFLLNTEPTEHRPEEYPIRILKFNNDQYTHDKDEHKHYWDWKRNRNETRSELEEQFGYDTKHASHLIRLLRTGYEILTEGIVKVKRPDAAELLDIRHGKYTYDEILANADELDSKIKTAYSTTSIRRQVDLKRAGKILIDLQEEFWSQ